ncbi:MAG: cadherin domain-containing protein [Fibrobacter sp.]|nr:cadherin domain-containing protein [Fibrobacter sp.]
MWFGKLSLKAAALVLVGAFSSAFAEVGVAPLTFGDASTDVNNWNYLTQYKLWGTNGIQLGNRPGFYDPKYFDKSTMSYPADIDLLSLGAVGTLKNLSSVGDGGWLDGPIVVGGNITNSGQNFEILTGPIRTNGSNAAIVRSGVQTCNLTASTGKCDPSITPDYRSTIKVPTLKSGISWGNDLNVSGGKKTLDVSSACSGSTCDLYYNAINFENDNRLVISIPDKHIARIFTKKLNLKTHPEIVVRDPVAGKDLTPSEYKGNLLIYVDGDITFENIDNVQIMGTLVSNGTLTMKCNMIISGQFIANEIVIGNEIDAKNFTFKPIQPVSKLIVDNNSKEIKESEDWYTLDVVLDKESDKVVTFDYCFDFYSADGVTDVYAGYNDVAAADASHKFPICNKGESEQGQIPIGQTKAKGIQIKALLDGLVEKKEALWFQVNNIKGAELSSDYEAGFGYKIYIVSDDQKPTVSSALVINVNEDSKHEFTAAEFKFQHTTQKFASVIFTSVPPSTKGTLTLNGTAVKAGTSIKVADLTKLVYQPAADDFGDSYTSFKYQVVGDGTGDNTSIEYTATVNVIPVNDKPSANNVKFTVAEHPDKNAVVGKVSPKDKSNEIDVDTYTFTKVSGDSRFVLASDGTVKVNGSVSFNAKTEGPFVIKATVKDNAATEKTKIAGPLTSDQFTITISINNENDPPTIGPQTFKIKEKQSNGKIWPAGTSVGKITTASDPDGDQLTFKILTPTDAPFKFSSDELVIKDGSVLDHETTPSYSLKVEVSDGQLTATATITVIVEDVNEGPEDLMLLGEYSVAENTATGEPIGTFTVFDPDEGDALYYSLSGALTGAVDATTAKKNLSDIFELKESKNDDGTRTVAIKVRNGALLDYEKLFVKSKGNATFLATVTVKDDAGLSVSKTTNIAVKDVNEKVSAKGGTFYLNEHSPIGSPVCAVQYKDDENNPLDCGKVARVEGSDLDIYADDDVYSDNDAFNNLTYQIIPSKNTGTDYKKFTINKNTGALSTDDEFDYESGARKFTFVVTVSDGKFTADANVVVIIDDIEEPKITTEYEGDVTVEENTGEGETVVDFVEILEKIKAENDEIRENLEKIKGKVSFKINQEASANANGVFAITTTAGKAFVKVKDPTKLNFEALYSKDKTKDKTTFKVVVVASGEDANGFDVEVSITMGITVTDVNESPEITNTKSLLVPETYTSEDGEFGKVTATDQDNAYGSVHPWGFNKLTYKVEEVLEVNGSTDFPFELNPNTGAFTVADGQKLDYTKQKQYKCVVKVVDNPKYFDDEGNLVYPAQSATKTIVIDVADVNRPSEFKVLTNPYEVEENVDVGTALEGKQIVVYDEDDADFDELVVTITDNNGSCVAGKNCAQDLFEVVQVGKTDKTTHLSTFVIKTKAGINYEALYDKTASEAAFDITLTIIDTEVRTKYPQQDTRIQIIDVNEAPAFTKTSYTFTVAENVAKETSLGTAEATDPDIYNARFGTLYFSLDGDEAAPFDINGSTGEITVSKSAKLDYELKKVYEFYAVVTDKKFTKKVPVTVNVTDVDEIPEFHDVPDLAVDENSATGTKVGVVSADDDDCKNSNTCKKPTYTLAATDVADDDYKSFSIDKTTGTIKVNGDLNFEKKDEYSVRVVATDGDDPTLTSYVDVTIKINDVNDKPTYEEKEYVFEIHEKAPKGEFVGSVVADDEDTWSVLGYDISDYLEGSGDAAIFDIDEEGNIYLTSKSLNYETKKQYQILAKATDNGKAYGAKIGRTDFKDFSATTLVTINIIDDPDGPKIIDDGKDSYDVKENTNEEPLKETEIACYEVKDEDEGQVATLVPYVTDNGDTDADRLFDAKIKKNGSKYELCLVVKNVERLNYESLTHTHSVNVNVMDADKLTAYVTKTVNLVDVNEMPIISGNATFSFYENKGKDYVIGRLYSDDIDTSKAFTQNKFSAVGGDTDFFDITEDGKIKAKRNFDYESEKNHTFELEVALSDKDVKTTYPKLTTTTTIKITLKDMPEVPEITSKQFSVDENSEPDVLIGVIEATDPDGEGDLLFSLSKENPYVIVKPNGEIRVREGANIDYESMQQFTITVTVKDSDGLEFDGDIVIYVNDLNEPPMIKPQEFTFPEDSKPGTKKGPVEASDPDIKNKKFSDLKFYPVEENEKFEIKTNGDIVLKGDLDYEKEKSYVIKVYVTDGEFTDTTEIGIKVGNVIEQSEVEITRVEAGDSVYIKPKHKTIYTNKDVITVEWKQDGKTMSSLDSLKEGCQYIIKSYKAPNKDVAGADSVEVCYSTAAPIVDIDASKTKVIAENIYTIVETVDKKDSAFYVNDKTKEVQVSVADSVSGKDTTFSVVVVLDTIAVSDKTVKNMVDVSKSEITLEKNPKSEVYEKPIGDKTKISYDKVVNGDSVTVSYFVDEKGEIIKTAVFDEDGKKTMTEVIEVSTVVDVKGKKVTVSYKADAETGNILYGDSEGNLMAEAPKSSSSKSDSKDKDEVDLKTGVGAFTVTYDAKGEDGNKTTVSYVVDEKGKIVANEEGDRGYLVTYTYTNIYGNSADKSVFMVLDKLAPIVKILTPAEGDVVFANFVDVDWCIAVDGDEKNCVKQDTLNFQSLTKGVNTIKRIYRDKAGNETIAEVNVMMKKAKDVNIDLEKPMILVSIDSVNKYYESNPPEENQRYAVSILNPKTMTEKEVVKGNTDGTKKGSGEEPYPGYDGHIGPTIKIDMKLPIVSAVGGLATLDDIIINGDMVALDGVDADGSKKVSVKDYVKDYCSAEFQEELGKDYSKAKLYETSARVTLWFFTTGGQFVDKYQFDYDVDDPEYVDKAGLVKFFFEMKPDINGELRDKSGRLYGTGPYIVKTKVDLRSKQRCIVPPVTEKSKIGDVLKSSDEMMKRFGYRRPVLRGNEKASSSAKKETKSSSKSDSKKSSSKK